MMKNTLICFFFYGTYQNILKIKITFQFKGTWFDLESYPTNFQSGTCNTANYKLNDDNTFDVENTQIVNQLLQSRPGTASPTTNDGSAKFEVSFLINGEYGEFIKFCWYLFLDVANH